MIYNARKEVGEREKAVKREVRGKRCLKGKSADIPFEYLCLCVFVGAIDRRFHEAPQRARV